MLISLHQNVHYCKCKVLALRRIRVDFGPSLTRLELSNLGNILVRPQDISVLLVSSSASAPGSCIFTLSILLIVGIFFYLYTELKFLLFQPSGLELILTP